MQISIHVIRIHTVVEQNICVANTCNKAGACPIECQSLQLLMKKQCMMWCGKESKPNNTIIFSHSAAASFCCLPSTVCSEKM